MLGKFITFEGGDGVGKSTQIRLLSEHLKAKGIECVVTREPGGGKISEEIRKILLNNNGESCSPICEALLMSASRVQHVHDVILPNLHQGKVVLCDRYVHSTYAYQGYGRGIDLAFLQTINEPATNLAMPDYVFLLNLPHASASARMSKRGRLDRIEMAGMGFHERVHRGFLELAEKDDKIIQIDAQLSMEEIHAQIVQTLKI